MEPTKTQLQQFKTIYKKEFKEDLNDKEAFEKAFNLINLVKIIYQTTK